MNKEFLKMQKLAGLITEAKAPSYAHMKPFKLDIAKMIKQLQDLNDKLADGGPLSEEIVDAIESLGELISKINIQTAKG